MLYILANRYFASDRIFGAIDPGLPVRVIYAEPSAQKRSALWTCLLVAEAAAGINFFSRRYFSRTYYEALRQIGPHDRVLFFFVVWNVRDFTAAAKNIPHGGADLWLWNNARIFSKHPRRRAFVMKLFRKYARELYTFDFGDAERYGLQFKEQVYYRTMLPSPPTGNTKDLFFVGVDKGRLALLVALREAVEAEGLSAFFHIVAGPSSGEQPPHLREHLAGSSLSYDQTLAHVARSRALVEIVPSGQQGSTLRAMEALFFGKKLITDNPAVEREAFYRPENIYRLGRETRTLRQFLDEPMVPVPQEVIDRHEINHWLRGFLA